MKEEKIEEKTRKRERKRKKKKQGKEKTEKRRGKRRKKKQIVAGSSQQSRCSAGAFRDTFPLGGDVALEHKSPLDVTGRAGAVCSRCPQGMDTNPEALQGEDEEPSVRLATR